MSVEYASSHYSTQDFVFYYSEVGWRPYLQTLLAIQNTNLVSTLWYGKQYNKLKNFTKQAKEWKSWLRILMELANDMYELTKRALHTVEASQ